MKIFLSFVIAILIFLVSCGGGEDIVGWISSSSNNYISADLSGPYNIHYNSQKIRYTSYNQIDKTKIISMESSSIEDNYLYDFSLEFPMKTGYFTDSSGYIKAIINIGIHGFNLSNGFVYITKDSANLVTGTFEFKAYEYKYNSGSSSIIIIDSISVKNGKFSLKQ